jgi:hypothetical protein
MWAGYREQLAQFAPSIEQKVELETLTEISEDVPFLILGFQLSSLMSLYLSFLAGGTPTNLTPSYLLKFVGVGIF